MQAIREGWTPHLLTSPAIARSVERLALGLRIDVEHIAAAPALRVWIVAGGSQPHCAWPVIGSIGTRRRNLILAFVALLARRRRSERFQIGWVRPCR